MSRVSRLECYTQYRITKMSRLHEVEMSVDVVERKNDSEMMIAWYSIGTILDVTDGPTDHGLKHSHIHEFLEPLYTINPSSVKKLKNIFVNKKRKDFLFSASDIPTVYYFDFTQQLVFRHYDFQTVIYYNFGKFILEKCNENARWNLCRRNSKNFIERSWPVPTNWLRFISYFEWVLIGSPRSKRFGTFGHGGFELCPLQIGRKRP